MVVSATYEVWRIIPAQAGNTTVRYAAGEGPSDHPRAGGEHVARADIADHANGSSPRRRGTLLS